MKKLAIFDMDGTLFDTLEVNYLSYHDAAAQIGYEIKAEDFSPWFGKNYKEFLPALGITDVNDMEKIHELKKDIYPSYLNKTKVNSFLMDYINGLDQEYTKALVTTASKKNVIDILTVFDMEKLFDFMITQEDTVRLKPDPQCYLLAMKRAGVGPENTVIFEDSQVGIEAAQASGAAVMQVRRF